MVLRTSQCGSCVTSGHHPALEDREGGRFHPSEAGLSKLAQSLAADLPLLALCSVGLDLVAGGSAGGAVNVCCGDR